MKFNAAIRIKTNRVLDYQKDLIFMPLEQGKHLSLHKLRSMMEET